MAQAAYDRLVFETPIVKIGAFRCRRDDPAFEDSGPTENDCIVFPRTAVAIEHDHERAFVSNPNNVNFYNRGDRYRRSAISDDGDRCDWFALRHDVTVEMMSMIDASAGDRADQPFARTHAWNDPRTYARQRQLFTAALRQQAEPLEIEEGVVDLVERVIRAAASDRKRNARELTATRRHRDLAHDAQSVLSRSFASDLTLANVAAALDVSVFHLCRVFQRVCGCTLHDYREQLRLRHSLERLAVSRTVVDPALDAGFSSHSHYGAAFRKAFGQTPSEFRSK